MEADPQELLEKARGGDEKARGELLQLYHKYLVRLASFQISRRLQGKVGASDLAQGTLLQALRDFGQFRGTTLAELKSWLGGILVHDVRKLVRHFFQTRVREVPLEREIHHDVERSSQLLDRDLVAPDSSPSRQAIRREQGVQLANALAELPAHYREVVVLRNLEKLSFAEVAQRMGRTVKSVERLWLRALKRLRQMLGGPDEHD